MPLLGHQKILDRLVKLARDGTLSHAYLFTGPAGIGKKTTALQFARAVEEGKKPTEHLLSDLVLAHPDADGKLGIDAVRRFHEQLLEQPQQGSYRIGIMSGAERLTQEAQNALLKLAEEPPSHAVLIVITPDPDALFGTLRSRLQPIAFAPVPEDEIIDWLQKEHRFTKKDAETYARRSAGCPGLAFRLGTDEKLRAMQENAQTLLAAAPRDRTALLKQLVEEEVSLADILDALIREVAYTVRETAAAKQDAAARNFWHAALTLRREATRPGLNTRLQLEALFSQ